MWERAEVLFSGARGRRKKKSAPACTLVNAGEKILADHVMSLLIILYFYIAKV